MINKYTCYRICVLNLLILGFSCNAKPKLTIVIVIDQFSYNLLNMVRPYLQGGLRFLLDEGILYANAHTSYALPATAPGHASLNTGTTPSAHGVVANSWYDEQLNKIVISDDDTPERAAVFGPTGMQPYGKSSHNLMVDGISDQLMLQKKRHNQYQVVSIGGKSRSAIFTAGNMGKAIWFDPTTGMFTSSKAYYEELPCWLTHFNTTIARRTPYTWHIRHKNMPVAYQFKGLYDCASCKNMGGMIGKTFCPDMSLNEPYARICQTPLASQMVFDCACAYLDAHYCKGNKERLFMWVLPSCLDKLGHDYGPHSQEAIDLIYHLDRQLKLFIDKVSCKTKKRNILWVLSTDHGVAPCPEQLRHEGYVNAHRILEKDLITMLNEELAAQFDVHNVIRSADAGALALDRTLFDTLDTKKQKQIQQYIIERTQRIPGIKKTWTYQSLYNLCTVPESIEQMFKHQLYPNRSSSFIIQTQPYSFITNYTYGTAHHSPYDYDTHIPLIIYRRAHLERKRIEDRVTNTQLAPTLAYLLDVPRPSASTTQILPGILYKQDLCW